jgi:hypothetical protein
LILSYTIPIVLEQSIAPVATKYSLGAKFSVSNDLFESIHPSYESVNFDGYFRRGDNLYGTVSWRDEDDQADRTEEKRDNNYKLEIEKLYVCSTYNDLVPLYDPEGSIYGLGAQHGCTRPDKTVRHRILLLDQTAGAPNGADLAHPLVNKAKFEARFFGEMLASSANNRNFSKYIHSAIMDGFKFNVDALFEIENLTQVEKSQLEQKKDSVWYVQTVYSIRPVHKRHLLGDVYNNGTNIQIVRLSAASRRPTSPVTLFNSRHKSKHDEDLSSQRIGGGRGAAASTTFVKVVMPLVLLVIILVIFVTMSIVYIYSHHFSGKAKQRDECLTVQKMKRRFKKKRTQIQGKMIAHK